MLDESRYVISFLISVLLYEYVFEAYSSVPVREVSRRSRADHVSKCGAISLIAEILIFDSTPNLFRVGRTNLLQAKIACQFPFKR